MNFSVNFMERTSAIIHEATKLKKYAAMPLGLAIVVGILMLPLALLSFVCSAYLYVLGYLFSVISLPAQRLHKLLHEEGQSVHHATQVVIYFLSWSFIFATYVTLSFFLIILTVLYSAFSILTYLWTLGGFKFHIFASDEDISVDINGTYKPLLPIIFVAISAGILILLPFLQTIGSIIDYSEYAKITFDYFTHSFKFHFLSSLRWSYLFSCLYSAFVFAPNPRK